ncbi:MAG TPA: metallophosphoesterase [Rhizomicrobium sp.]|jgi:3',5'-cyclic AMP phosphodiesterase CpdA|nr:metallophosphoesterase [Rhizomicrobium sp.]
MADQTSRRGALKCLGVGACTLFTLSSGVFGAINLAEAATRKDMGAPLFVQISDTHIGFNKDANPDVVGTLNKSIDFINALPQQPAFAIHTGDITHLSKAEEFDEAQQLLKRMRVSEIHAVPGEHDVTDGPGTEFFNRYGKASANKGYYAFDAAGVHFIALVNVMDFKAGGLGALGDNQLAWLKNDLAGRSASQPIVVFAHMPLWTIYEPWGWGTAEGDQIAMLLARFGSVTVLNGHIHQIVQKVEGNITFHTARSTAYPQPTAGTGPGPGPLKVPTEQLPKMLGVTTVKLTRTRGPLTLADSTLA